jgi:hypothetical protein
MMGRFGEEVRNEKVSFVNYFIIIVYSRVRSEFGLDNGR